MAGVIAFGGFAAYAKFSPANRVPEAQLRKDRNPAAEPSEPRIQSADVTLLKPVYNGDDLTFESSKGKAPSGEDSRVFAVNEYLKKLPQVPAGSRLLSCQVADAVATLDFSPEFETTYATEDERTVLEGILTVMGQFDGIDAVRFTVAGKTLETLGNVDLTTPQPVLRPDGSRRP